MFELILAKCSSDGLWAPIHDPTDATSTNPRRSQGYGSSIKAIKRMVFNVSECGYAEALNRERDIFTRVWGSEAHLHAIDAVHKRLNVKP